MSDILTPPEMTFRNLVEKLVNKVEFFKNHLEAIFIMKIEGDKPSILSTLFNYNFEEEFFSSLEATSNLISSISNLYNLGKTPNTSFQSIELKTKKILFFHRTDNEYKIFLVASEEPVKSFQNEILLFQLLEDNIILLDDETPGKKINIIGYSLMILDLLGIADKFGVTFSDPLKEIPIEQLKSRLSVLMGNNRLLTRSLRNRQMLSPKSVVKELVEAVIGNDDFLGFGGFSLSQDTGINSLLSDEIENETRDRIFEVLFGEEISLASYLARETKMVDTFDLGGGKWIVVSRPSPSSLLYFVVPSQRVANLLKTKIDEVHELISAILPEFFGY